MLTASTRINADREFAVSARASKLAHFSGEPLLRMTLPTAQVISPNQ